MLEKNLPFTISGLWKWKVLPFGMTSAPAVFQKLMEWVLHGLNWKSLPLYLDDIVVITPDFQTHMSRMEEDVQRLQQAGLKLKPAKCELLQKEVAYLGHLVSSSSLSTGPGKVAAIKVWPTPKGLKELQAFLGTIGSYQQYLKEFTTNAKQLNRLTSKGMKWNLAEEA